jgi:hypothetical protein
VHISECAILSLLVHVEILVFLVTTNLIHVEIYGPLWRQPHVRGCWMKTHESYTRHSWFTDSFKNKDVTTQRQRASPPGE